MTAIVSPTTQHGPKARVSHRHAFRTFAGSTMAPVKLGRPRVSYADLQRAPEDGRRYELYDGEVFVVPAPIPLHQLVAHRFANLLQAYQGTRGGVVFLSPIDIVFSDLDVLQPDVVFFRRGREELIDLRAPIRAVPDLVAEVLSPSTATTDRGRKMQIFARYGVLEDWLVDPEGGTVEIYSLVGGNYLLAQTASGSDSACSPIFPEFLFRVSELFGPMTAA
jgi:Uma2 family endonuclease